MNDPVTGIDDDQSSPGCFSCSSSLKVATSRSSGSWRQDGRKIPSCLPLGRFQTPKGGIERCRLSLVARFCPGFFAPNSKLGNAWSIGRSPVVSPGVSGDLAALSVGSVDALGSVGGRRRSLVGRCCPAFLLLIAIVIGDV